MAGFLLELLSEEIPARMQARAAADLERLFAERLKAAGLAWTSLVAHVTPRRMALGVEGLPLATPDSAEERKGPRVDAPEAAIQGFLRATGLTLEQCEQRETPKGPVWFAVFERPGRPTAEVLAEAVTAVLDAFSWPKSMRWGDCAFRWVRPLHQIMAVFDGKPLPGAATPEGGRSFPFVARTPGHRFLAPQPFAPASFEAYEQGLRERFVMLDRAERMEAIATGAASLAAAEGLTLHEDRGLLEEVAGLVEWPVPLLGRIDDSFMDLPPEVLQSSMRAHQRYFALDGNGDALAPYFVVIANMKADDDGAAIVAGNERVLRARLSDARFFWDQDRRARLEERVPALAEITFHARLGSMRAKAARMERLAAALAPACGADPAHAARAAHLAKADLVTGMVGEFPELQGVMGRYYAIADDEDPTVAEAIAEHYAPLGPNDRCPNAPVSIAVALADKIDTLVGFWSIGETPTGSRDPFALRRAALGVIRLIVENDLTLDLRAAFEAALGFYAEAGDGEAGDHDVLGALSPFIVDRVKVNLRDRGVRHDLIDAAAGLGVAGDINRMLKLVAALETFLASDDGANLLAAYRRADRIRQIELRKEATPPVFNPERLQEAEEKALWERLGPLSRTLQTALDADDFTGAMTALAQLRAPVDAFFDAVLVNAEDAELRRNRLALLGDLTSTMNQVADFSRVEG